MKEYHLCGKKIVPDRCRILYDAPFEKDSLEDCFEIASGEWHVDQEGWLTGICKKNAGGIIYSRTSYEEDVCMEFDAKTVHPCCNDLNWVIKTSGWDYEKDDAGPGYIMGLGGWWLNKAGIEKYPQCKLRAMTSCYPLEPGIEYHIFTGSFQGHCFIFVNDTLVLEMIDPEPGDFTHYGRIGFGTYASHIRYNHLKVYRTEVEPTDFSYQVD